jgi:hypothetical protein
VAQIAAASFNGRVDFVLNWWGSKATLRA